MQEAIYYEGQVISIGGDSLGIVIPKSNAEYLGIEKGNKVKVKIIKVEGDLKCQEQK